MESKKLKIYYTTDTHGHVLPVDYASNSHANLGIANMAVDFKKRDENTIIIDGGDTLQGSSLSYNIAKNMDLDIHPFSEVMNLAGYDFVTLGNHDFNYGKKLLESYIDNLDAICLCANVEGLANVKKHKIFSLPNRMKIGITGIVTDFVNVWEKHENLNGAGIKITDSIDALKNVIINFDKENVNIKICIYHGGIEIDLDTNEILSTSKENLAYRITKEVNLDILLTGHQHMSIPALNLNDTWIVQTNSNSNEYIELDLNLDEKNNISINSKLVKTGSKSNQDILNFMKEYEEKTQVWLDIPVGRLDTVLKPSSHLDMALNGSYLVNFFNQVQLAASNADISCTSLANTVKGFDLNVSIRDVVSTYIYSNTLVVLRVSREILKKALERCAEYFDLIDGEIIISNRFLKPKIEHYNYDYYSGIDYVIDLKKPVGSRVVSIKYNGKELPENKTLTLALNEYRATGTGGYDFFRDCQIENTILTEISELIIDYISNNKNIEIDKKKHYKILK